MGAHTPAFPLTGAPIAVKPLLRGVSHQVAFFIALVAGAVLAFKVPGEFRVSAIVYGLSLATLLGVSALYHRPQWSKVARNRMRKLDHASIFILIAGTATPFCARLPPEAGDRFLVIIWTLGVLGVLRAVFWTDAPKPLVAILAIGMGWSVTPYWREMGALLGPLGMTLFVAGGILYSGGALAYALKRPNPWPRVFGYHEIFHAAVILAAACHFVAITRVLLA